MQKLFHTFFFFISLVWVCRRKGQGSSTMGCAQQAGWGRSKGRERCEEQFGAAEHRHNQQPAVAVAAAKTQNTSSCFHGNFPSSEDL